MNCSACITIATFVVSLAVMYAVNAMGILRVSEEGERFGLDLHEHGISAYPEYVLSTLGAPAGMAKDTVMPAPSAAMSRAARPFTMASSLIAAGSSRPAVRGRTVSTNAWPSPGSPWV